jgi:2-dehydro-3-deoxyphosphogalactonate aldolase
MSVPAGELAALVDWGSTSLRVYSASSPPRLLHADAAGGVLSLPACDAAAFASALERALGAAAIASRGAVVVCGMAGSARGWREAPYVRAPPGADARALAAAAVEVAGAGARRVLLLPGVRCASGNANGADDVMRGEETQCLGAAGGGDALVLPGTHSKWVRLDARGSIAAHTTFLTGELYALLTTQSILAASVAPAAAADAAADADAAAADAAAFFAGLRQPAPLAALFSVRVRDVLAAPADRPAARAHAAAFLSGALIALELREARAWLAAARGDGAPAPRVRVIGAPALAARYAAAINDGGWAAAEVEPGDAAAAGLAAAAAALGFALGGAAAPPPPLSPPPPPPPPAAAATLHASRLARWRAALAAAPLVVILRGVEPAAAVAVGEAAVAGGARVLEVPLNSPSALESIRALAAAFAARPDVLVGAGTVLCARDAADVAAAGGELVLAPNADAAVIAAARAAGLLAWPGVATATEAFAALGAGATGLKLFPCTAVTPATVRALRAVLPRAVPLLAVGGVDARNAREYAAAGCDGAGVGTAIYAPGDAPGAVEARVREFLDACR